MNGIHDLGGMHGLGPIKPEANEPVFHEAWEGRAFGMFAAIFVSVGITIDEMRHEIEKMNPAEYLEHSYYEHWLSAFEGMLISRGIVSREELGARQAAIANGGQ